jgi:RecB family exonuclease
VTAWSYSSIKTFDQCPKKFFHLRVAKDVEDVAGPEASYGTDVHKAAELYIKEGTPIPEKYAFIRPYVEELDRRAGVKYAELKVGVRKEDGAYLPCGFFDKGVWYRGVIDLLVVDGARAWMVDYKTGKSAKYADMKQLDLMAGAVFTHFPEVKTIKSALLYVVSKEFPKKTHVREKQGEYLSVFSTQLDRLDSAMENGVWNPKQGPLCGWCPVKACEHNQPRRGW